VEAVGAQALAAEGVPSLQKRTGGRKQEEGKTHGCGERTQNPPSRLFAAARLPKSAGQDGQEQQARSKKQDVSTRRNMRPGALHQGMGVDVAEQISQLIERQADDPYSRRSAKPRKNQFGQDRLD